jgi:hypothetical protein
MSDCKLVGAQLQGTNLTDADVPGCDMSNADLSGADMRGANLTLFKYDSQTKFPKNIDVRAIRSDWGYIPKNLPPP